MSLYRPKGSKVWWYEFQFANQRVRESTKTRSKTLAVEAERNRHRELERAFNGVKKRSSAKLFGGAAEEWLALKALNLAASSIRIEKANLKHILPSFSRRLVTDIEAGDIAKYQQTRLGEGAASKTVNLEVGTIRSILRRNRVWADIQQDVRMLATADNVGKALTAEEELALLRACLESRSRSLYPAVVIALNTGMRYSEIRLLQWKQISLEGKTLLVGKSKTENGTGRTIPLNRRLLAVMEMWSARFPDRTPDQFVFPSEKYGAATNDFEPCTYATDLTKPINDWKEAWEGAKKRAGVALAAESRNNQVVTSTAPASQSLQCRFHDLRHTACTSLLEGGVPYPVVSTIMGWSAATGMRMAKRYGHIGQRSLRDAMELLGRSGIVAESPKNSPKSASTEDVSVN
jgi:integrase